MPFTPEDVVKTLAASVRAGGADLLYSSALEGGDPHQIKLAKAYSDVVTDRTAVSGGVDVFSPLLPLARRRSIIGQIAEFEPFYNVPPALRVLAQNTTPSAGFIQEGKHTPITQADVETTALVPKTIRAIQVVTDDLVMQNDLEHLLSRGLIRGVAKAESAAFFSNAAASNDAPAGVFYGISPETGTANLESDVETLVDAFDGDLSAAVFICAPKTAMKLAGIYDGAGLNGSIAGLPIVAHQEVPNDELAIIQPDRIKICDDGLLIDESNAAGILLSETPQDDIDAALATPSSPPNDNDVKALAKAKPVSLFQMNLLAFRITRYINWEPATDAAVWLNGGTW